MYKDKPIIGVTPLYDSEKDSYWMLPGYMKGIEEQGGIPLMLPLTDAADELDFFLTECDGFLFTGGQDISPSLYHATASTQCGELCPARDSMEAALLRGAVEKDLAVLGICRGIQFLNAVYGGTLYQDLPTEHPSALEHHMQPPYDRISHSVSIVPDTPLADLLQLSQLGVNSYHHQAVAQLSAQFQPMAIATDGIVEAIYMPDRHFVWGIQWHPEFSYLSDDNSRKLFSAFLRAARRAG